MDFAFVLDPLASLKAYKDSSIAIMREAHRRNHRVFAFEPGDMAYFRGAAVAACRRLELLADDADWHRAFDAGMLPLGRFDGVFMRKDPPFDMEYLYATQLLDLAQAQGTKVFNSPRALRDFNEKLAIARFPQFTVPTLVSRRQDWLREFVTEQRDAVLKPLDAMGGAGVFRVHSGDPNLGVILETLTHHGMRTVMAQRYIPEIRDGDKRVLLVDGEPMPFCLARIPRPGETRGNLAAGGTGVARPLTERDREIALALGPALAAEGLLLVGLDVIGDWLTEVNVTSPTCLREIQDQTGFDTAAKVVDAMERRCR